MRLVKEHQLLAEAYAEQGNTEAAMTAAMTAVRYCIPYGRQEHLDVFNSAAKLLLKLGKPFHAAAVACIGMGDERRHNPSLLELEMTRAIAFHESKQKMTEKVSRAKEEGPNGNFNNWFDSIFISSDPYLLDDSVSQQVEHIERRLINIRLEPRIRDRLPERLRRLLARNDGFCSRSIQ